MIDDDAQIGYGRAQGFDPGFGICRASADDVQGHAPLREVAQVGELRSVERDCGRTPQEAAYADEPVIVRELFEVAGETGRADFKLAYKKRKEGIVSQQIEDPLVIFD